MSVKNGHGPGNSECVKLILPSCGLAHVVKHFIPINKYIQLVSTPETSVDLFAPEIRQ